MVFVLVLIVLVVINVADNVIAQKIWPATTADNGQVRLVYRLVFLGVSLGLLWLASKLF